MCVFCLHVVVVFGGGLCEDNRNIKHIRPPYHRAAVPRVFALACILCTSMSIISYTQPEPNFFADDTCSVGVFCAILLIVVQGSLSFCLLCRSGCCRAAAGCLVHRRERRGRGAVLFRRLRRRVETAY